MIYPHNFEQKIGFDSIREMLKSYCLSSLGEEEVDKMHFSSDKDTLTVWLNRVDEFVQLEQSETVFPQESFFDMRSALSMARVEGTWLDIVALFDLKRSLKTILRIVEFFGVSREDADNFGVYPYLSDLAHAVPVFPEKIARIEQILNDFGEVKDTASIELTRIRQELSEKANSVSRILDKILRQAQADGMVEADVVPTMRNGRLVIPVAPAFKRKLRGIVHDESGSGKTVYIEPAEVVEANNRIRELEAEERREIVRILQAFTAEIRPSLDMMLASYDFLAQIDFIRAKAQLAINIPSVLPVIEDKAVLLWHDAKHPLLYVSLKLKQREVVPLDIELDSENHILIISGPNAGGKSVCLKTVGLLQYMFQCGLLLPLDERSIVGVFRDIYIDIGDEQSMENDLSTYSSHLTNMKYFVKNATDRSLLLIDEFGGGTEPQIGGAIAEALLRRFHAQQAYGVITTHYQNLKEYANKHKGVVNGSMLYDRHLMRPMFKLSIGNPGSSFAIEIAHKIGLPQQVIDDASQIAGSDYINLDRYLQDIARDKSYWSTKRKRIREREKQIEQLERSLEETIVEIEKQRKSIMQEGKKRAEMLFENVNAQIENTIRAIRETQADRKRTQELRKKLADFQREVFKEEESQILGNNKYIEKIRNTRRKTTTLTTSVSVAKENAPIVVNDYVRIKGQSVVGQVLKIAKNKAEIAVGMVKTTVKLEHLEKANKQASPKQHRETVMIGSHTLNAMHEKRLHFKSDIDIRGMRGEEALQAVTYFIDDAIQLGISHVRILHGTGTGALRELVRNYLRSVSGVRHFADENVQLGGAGITVVDLE